MIVFKRILGQIMVLVVGVACVMLCMWLNKQQERNNIATHECVNELGEAQR